MAELGILERIKRGIRADRTSYEINKFKIEQRKANTQEQKKQQKALIDAQIQKYKLEREHQFQVDQLKKEEEKKRKDAKRFSPWDF